MYFDKKCKKFIYCNAFIDLYFKYGFISKKYRYKHVLNNIFRRLTSTSYSLHFACDQHTLSNRHVRLIRHWLWLVARLSRHLLRSALYVNNIKLILDDDKINRFEILTFDILDFTVLICLHNVVEVVSACLTLWEAVLNSIGV